MSLLGSGKNAISQSVINLVKQQASADVYVKENITVPAKSYFFLPIGLKEEVKQPSTFFYIQILQTLQERHELADLKVKMPNTERTILVINPTSENLQLRKNTQVAYIEQNLDEIAPNIYEEKDDPDAIYIYRFRKEFDESLKYTENSSDNSLFGINPKLPGNVKQHVSNLLYSFRGTFEYK